MVAFASYPQSMPMALNSTMSIGSDGGGGDDSGPNDNETLIWFEINIMNMNGTGRCRNACLWLNEMRADRNAVLRAHERPLFADFPFSHFGDVINSCVRVCEVLYILRMKINRESMKDIRSSKGTKMRMGRWSIALDLLHKYIASVFVYCSCQYSRICHPTLKRTSPISHTMKMGFFHCCKDRMQHPNRT